MDAKFSSILHTKIYFFYFTHPFLQNTHISLSILHIYSIKYSFFYNFLLFSPSLPLSLTNPTLSHRPNTQRKVAVVFIGVWFWRFSDRNGFASWICLLMLLLALKIQILQGMPFLLLIFLISCLVGEKVVEKSRNRRKDDRLHSNLSEVYQKFIYLFILFFFFVFFLATKQILCNTNFWFYLILEEIFWCGVLCWCMVWRSLLIWCSLMISNSESEVRLRATRETKRRREKKLLKY